MSGTKYTIAITEIGVDNPTYVQAQDTVVWQCDSSINSAAITFTGSEPFTKSLGGTVTLGSNGTSSTYTVTNDAKTGKYPYNVVVKMGNAQTTYSCDIQVMSAGTALPGTHGLVG